MEVFLSLWLILAHLYMTIIALYLFLWFPQVECLQYILDNWTFEFRLAMFAGMTMIYLMENQRELLECPLVICHHMKMPR